MQNAVVKKVVFVALALSSCTIHSWSESQCTPITRTCPCNQVPYISEDADTDLYIQKFKEVSPRSQRAQLAGFAKQYVKDGHEAIEAVMIGSAKVYSDRMGSDELYKLAIKLIADNDKKPMLLKIFRAVGKLYKSALSEDEDEITRRCACGGSTALMVKSATQRIESFKNVTPSQQRVQLANYVADYVNNQTEILEEVLVGCAQVYCERVQSQTINKLIHDLLSAYDKKAAEAKILQTLGFR